MAQVGRAHRTRLHDGGQDVPPFFVDEGQPDVHASVMGRDDLGVRADAGADHGLAQRFGLAGRHRVVVACIVAVMLIGGFALVRLRGLSAGFEVEREEDVVDAEAAEEDVPSVTASEVPEAACVVVHVDGAVREPGVYEVAGDTARVGDAVTAAGGLAEDADTTAVNLAETLVDGTKVYIPHVGDAWGGEAIGPAATVAGDAGSAARPSSGKVNLNTATIDELKSLPGIGDAMATAIVNDRTAKGAFGSVEDLKRVDGIGDKRFDKVKDLVCV